jgi:hypothetical protein
MTEIGETDYFQNSNDLEGWADMPQKWYNGWSTNAE